MTRFAEGRQPNARPALPSFGGFGGTTK